MSESDAPSRRWPIRRLMRIAQLAGLGWTYDEIAGDAFVKSTAGAVRMQLTRFGISIREVARGAIRFSLSRDAALAIDDAAARRAVTPSELLRLVGEILGKEPDLLDNILDDQK